MTQLRFALVLIGLAVVASVAAPTPAPVKRGVSDSARAKLLAQSAKAQEAEAKATQAQAKRVADALNGRLARHQQQARAAAEKHPGWAAYQRDLDALQRDLAKRRTASSGKGLAAFSAAATAALAKLHESHRALFADALRAAQLDDRTALRALSEAFAPYGKVQAKSRGDGTYTLQRLESEEPAPPPQTIFTFGPAYAEKATSSRTEGFAYEPRTVVDLAEGLAGAAAGPGGAGYQICRAAVAEFVTVPRGYHRLRATMRGNVTWDYGAFAMGGASACSGQLTLRVDGLGGDTVTRTRDLGGVVAPVAYWVADDGDEPFAFTATVDLPDRRGGEYLVQAGGLAEGWAAAVGGAFGRTSVIVEQLQIEALE